MRIDWACAPFAVRLPPPHEPRRCECLVRRDSWFDVRTVEEHKEVVPIASQMFRESLVGRIGESAVQQAVHLRLEESLGNAQAMRADLASIAPIAQGEGVPEDGLDQAWETAPRVAVSSSSWQRCSRWL